LELGFETQFSSFALFLLAPILLLFAPIDLIWPICPCLLQFMWTCWLGPIVIDPCFAQQPIFSFFCFSFLISVLFSRVPKSEAVVIQAAVVKAWCGIGLYFIVAESSLDFAGWVRSRDGFDGSGSTVDSDCEQQWTGLDGNFKSGQRGRRRGIRSGLDRGCIGDSEQRRNTGRETSGCGHGLGDSVIWTSRIGDGRETSPASTTWGSLVAA
jgi:hypothetical protein